MITLSRREDGMWLVVGHGFEAYWSDLDFAACSALRFADTLGAETPTLAAGVPADALERGRRMMTLLNAE